MRGGEERNLKRKSKYRGKKSEMKSSIEYLALRFFFVFSWRSEGGGEGTGSEERGGCGEKYERGFSDK